MMVLGWKYPDVMLPHYGVDLPHKVLAESLDVRRGFNLLSDARSRTEFLAQLRFRLFADLDALPHPDQEPQYLASGLYAPNHREVIVDGGAYDGDTLRSLLASGRSFDQYVALEPDGANFAALERYVATLPTSIQERVTALPLAAYSERKRMRIEESGSASAVLVAATGPESPNDVQCVPLDEICAERRISFLKLDIEGAEPDAIRGACRVIARDRPIVAVCVYHRQNHLWSLPLLVQSMVDDYRYYLRPYNEEGWDLVCYAVPKERALAVLHGR
jgi:FkbM family methyltransferase